MGIDKRWLLLLALGTSALAGAAIAAQSRRRQRRVAHDLDHGTQLKSWENEGGNPAPAPIAAAAA